MHAQPQVAASDEADAGRGGTAVFGRLRATRPVEHLDLARDGDRLTEGFWAVVGDFEGRVHAWRFAEVERDVLPSASDVERPWTGPDPAGWTSSMSHDDYLGGVAQIRTAVHEGEVYQVNLCRVLSAPLPRSPVAGPGCAAPADRRGEPDPLALAARLAVGNPAPYAGVVHVPASSGLPGVWAVSASPELFLRVGGGLITSGPIKGTATTPNGLTVKDEAENIMIADMVRNDLQQVCDPGSVEVTALLAVEQHPGLVHLVTTVQGRLRAPTPSWPAVLAATYPPASVSGAPKLAALEVIRRLEPVPRGPYCGAFGWIDADTGRAELAVAIRTFWWTDQDGGTLRFGTGAGITWGSDAAAEWAETELKAARLVALASAPPGSVEPTSASPDGPAGPGGSMGGTNGGGTR